MPLAWQSLVPPRPVGTCLLIEASLEPLWPGSRNTIMPAMLAGAAEAGLTSVEAATSRPVAIARADTQALAVHGRHRSPLATRLKAQPAACG